MKKRSEIAEEYKWDLSDYAISAEDCLQKAEKIQKSLVKFIGISTTLLTSKYLFLTISTICNFTLVVFISITAIFSKMYLLYNYLAL